MSSVIPFPIADRSAPPSDSIGGTAAVMLRGLSKYGGQHKVYRKLHQLDPPIERTFDMKRGIVLEDPVVDRVILDQTESWFGEDRILLPSKLWGTGVIYDPDYEGIHATIDRILFDEDHNPVGILEVKTYNCTFYKYNWDREDHSAQVAHYAAVVSRALQRQGRLAPGQYLTENYLLVCQTRQGKWKDLVHTLENEGHDAVVSKLTEENGVHIECRRLRSSKVNPESYEKNELLFLAEWYKKYVGDNPRREIGPWMVLPPTDRTKDCRKSLKEQKDAVTAFGPLTGSLGESQAQSLVDIGVLLERRDIALTRQKESSERAKEQKGLVSEIDSEIKLLMSGYTLAEIDGIQVRVKQRAGRRTFDSARFKKEHPDLFEEYIKQGDPTDVVDIN